MFPQRNERAAATDFGTLLTSGNALSRSQVESKADMVAEAGDVA
jgi:hypothetical protein